MQFHSYGLTDVGLKRSHNEDNYGFDDELGLYVVADGMGGHAAGEVASSTAINAIFTFIRQFHDEREIEWPFGYNADLTRVENALVNAIHLANDGVCRLAGENQAYSGMGTTIAGLLIDRDFAVVGHLGDSRVYRLRNEVLECLTMDHSWVNEQLRKNILTEEEARNHRWRNVITRALGNKLDIEVELQSVDMEQGDLFLLCTDGLSSMVTEEAIREILIENKDDLDRACNLLLSQANANGGIDNVTSVLLSVDR